MIVEDVILLKTGNKWYYKNLSQWHLNIYREAKILTVFEDAICK